VNSRCRVFVLLIAFLSCSVVVAPGAQGKNASTARLEQRVEAKLKVIHGNSKAKNALYRKARSDSQFCSHCHGVDGNSAVGEIPRLAGQNPVYLLDQIQRFASGKRQDYIMTGLAAQLSDDAKVTLAVYFSQQTPKKVKADLASPQEIARGAKKYDSICFACHGSDGKGTEGYARIAGQHERYIIHTLTNFKDGTGGRHSTAMSSVAKGLSNEDITALAAYIHNMD
jgi:cytochrome c553